MKTKNFFHRLSLLGLVALAMAFATTFIACGDKNDIEDPDDPVTPVNPVNPGAGVIFRG